MSKPRVTITMSLDGYVAEPDQSEQDPLGVGGEQFHELISVVPVLLGAGARLFDDLEGPAPRLRQVEAVAAPGVTHIRYARLDGNGPDESQR